MPSDSVRTANEVPNTPGLKFFRIVVREVAHKRRVTIWREAVDVTDVIVIVQKERDWDLIQYVVEIDRETGETIGDVTMLNPWPQGAP